MIVIQVHPLAPHAMMHGLTQESFKSWLEILESTTQSIYDEEQAKIFMNIGEIMSKNFMRNLGI